MAIAELLGGAITDWGTTLRLAMLLIFIVIVAAIGRVAGLGNRRTPGVPKRPRPD